MAQQGGRRKQAPAYSADTMALRYIAGLALAALGVMIFMAVDLNMSGNIFQGLRQVSFGACGSLAYVLAALPLWAGGLVIWSTQRRAPVRPWIFALLSFIGLCTFIMLISGNAMQSLDKQNNGNWLGVIGNVYNDCISKLANSRNDFGGGALGVILGWPLWKFLGTILGVILIFLGTLFCLLMTVNLTPLKIRDIFTGQYSARKEQQEQERIYAEQQQMAWQQQQAMQQQAWQQQQAYILEQQQQYRQAQGVPQNMPQNIPQPASQPMPQNTQSAQQSVEQWQDQMTARQTAASAPADHQSRIFGGRNSAQDVKPARSWKSRIFGKKEEEYDGLVGDDNAAAVPVTVSTQPRKPARRTVNGEQIGEPATRWDLENREAEAAIREQAAKPPRTNRANRTQQAQPPVQQPVQQQMIPEEPEQPVRAKTPEPKIPKTVNRDDYRRPADRTEKPAEPAEPARPARRHPETPAEAPAQKVKAPAVQQEISKETWSPELNLDPSDKAPHTPEETEWIPVPYN